MDNKYIISNKLIEWYKVNKRDLPWRHTKDPYKIWISEIIMQQTRVAQGEEYYNRFVERFPDVKALAMANEDEVLKYWQGLGYYSRARNLHSAAKSIIRQYNGVFPDTYEGVLSLKGVGEYTAAAITSFAWEQPYAVVDGNVFRVLARLFGIYTPIDTGKGKKEFTQLAAELMDPEQAGEHNQAIMEFGALQCTPQSPDCSHCPLHDRCIAYNENNVQTLPVKQNKVRTRDRFFHYFHIIKGEETWLNRRSGKDIWEGLYEFPLIETETNMTFEELQQTAEFQKLFDTNSSLVFTVGMSPVKHVLSHQVIYAAFYKLEFTGDIPALSSFLRINSGEIDNYAVSRLVELYLEKGGQLSFNYTV